MFQPDALPEAYVANAATDDERYYVPFTEMVSPRPLWILPTQNMWCAILMANKKARLVNRHYHPPQAFAYTYPRQVFAYTISGQWGYLEHDWTATVGDFVYDAPGERHTLVAFDLKDPMKRG